MSRGLALLAVAALAFAAGVTVRAGPTVMVDPAMVMGPQVPQTLSAYGFFADGTAQVPVDGVHPYRLNTPLYSDGAEKLRFAYVPPGYQAKSNGDGLIDFPVGSALIKTFRFDGRLIETRVLLHRADGWLALPYRWNEAQTDATLAVAGARLPVTTPAGEAISYRIPNKNQCKECHGLGGQVVPIGPKARNLAVSWLGKMVAAGALDKVPAGADALPLWEDRESASVDPALAARGYLEVNCAHCHRPGAAASNSGLDLRWDQHDLHALGIMKRPVAAGRGAGDLLFDVVPGEPEQSILLHRMSRLEGGVAMPELGKATLDQDGIAIVRRWIAGLK